VITLTKVGIIAGSIRKDSVSKKIGEKVGEMFPQGFEARMIEIGNLPHYNEDIDVEGSTPAEYTSFRNTLREMDAILFVTPEYNRSIPGVLKNAIDVGSRPYGASSWDGKPAAIISHDLIPVK